MPYRQITAKALEEGVRNYLERSSTYLDALTESIGEPSVIFRAIEQLLNRLPILWPCVVQMLITYGFYVDDFAQAYVCPNGWRCRKAAKRECLNWARAVFGLHLNILQICAAEGILLLGSGRGCGMLRTHTTECKLF